MTDAEHINAALLEINRKAKASLFVSGFVLGCLAGGIICWTMLPWYVRAITHIVVSTVME